MVNRRDSVAGATRINAEGATETLRQISSTAGITVWRWDVAADRVHSDLFGGLQGEGTTLREKLRALHPEDAKRGLRVLRRASRSEETGSFEFRSNPAQGAIHHYRATYFSLSPRVMQIIVQDVTRTLLIERALRESEDHHRHAVEFDPQVPWLADPDGSIIEFGPRWLALVELSAAETLGEGWASALHPDDLEPTLRAWRASIESGEPLDANYRVRLKSGAYRWMRARAAARRNAEGQIIRWYGTLEDIHDRMAAEAALRESDAFARSILEASPMAIEVLDTNGTLIFMNGPGIRVMEVENFETIRGKPFVQFWPPDAQGNVARAIARARLGETVRQTLFGPTAKGAPRWWDITISPIHGEDGEVARLLALSSDVTEAKLNEAEIAYLAQHDNLTGLPNRMQFQDRLNEMLEALTEGRLAVLSVDLDDFKLVNDTMGHLAGDELLKAVADRLQGAARSASLVARLGGDEFALLLRMDDATDAAETARAILEAIAQPFAIDGGQVQIGASIGIAIAPRDGRDAGSLMHAADVALYRVKGQKGRDYRYFEPAMDEALRQRRDMKRELALALSRGELYLVFQPQVDIEAKRLTGFEALLRWRSPSHGEVPPITFIPLAEESGLIEQIGAFALQQACAEAVRWPSSITVAVNLSPVQFRNGGVFRAVMKALESSGLPASRLEVEITESALLDASVEAVSTLEEFHRMGIRVALDDFGTGYSSLNYLRRFPFDRIKIDRSFVADLPDAESSRAIVRAIVGLGRSFKSMVTAEGVESWEQLMLLQAEGCNEAQGYLFSPPMPAGAALELARRGLPAPQQKPHARQNRA